MIDDSGDPACRRRREQRPRRVDHVRARPSRTAPTRHDLPAQEISAEVLIEKYAKGDERSAEAVNLRVARALAEAEPARRACALGGPLRRGVARGLRARGPQSSRRRERVWRRR
jgi:hypothetical protein